MPIKAGDRVSVHYTGRLKDGTEFDSSKGRSPLEFVVGEGKLIPGFEKGVLGHEKGDKLTISIPAEEAYGQVDPDLVFTVDKEKMPEDIPLEKGVNLQLSNEQGQMDVVIREVGEKSVVLDANHPLAGNDLIFDLDIQDVKSGK